MSDIHAEINALEERRCRATVENDFNELDRLLSDRVFFTHTSGKLDTKATYVDSLRTGALKYRSIDRSDVQIATYGDDVAVVSMKARAEVTVSIGDKSLYGQATVVWLRTSGGAWQCVSYQTTPILA
ncbi:MAG: nuclear transport factor 2 family protein [Acidimicrobiia bacterium]